MARAMQCDVCGKFEAVDTRYDKSRPRPSGWRRTVYTVYNGSDYEREKSAELCSGECELTWLRQEVVAATGHTNA